MTGNLLMLIGTVLVGVGVVATWLEHHVHPEALIWNAATVIWILAYIYKDR